MPEQAEPGAVERLTIYANQSSIDTQHGRDLRRDLRTLLSDLARMKAALEPLAEYADPHNRVPADYEITKGSPLAKRQLRMSDCYAARLALRHAR